MKPLAPAPASHDRRRVGWLSLAQLITWGSVFYTFALLMEPLERELGMSRAESSLGFSIALLAEGLLAYPVGRWIDRGHERAVMTFGSLAIAAGLLLHGAIHSAAGFYAAWALLGCALAATLYTPVFAVVTRRYPRDFRRAIITLTFLGGLASTVFIPLSAWLIATLGWRQALWVLAALHLLVCVPIHFHCLRDAPAPRPVAVATSPAMHLASAPFLLIGVFVVLMMAVTAALLFVLLYGLGNGMLTIVKGTAIAQYVSRDHVASLNGALGLPTALARAVAPWLLGVLWTQDAGYRYGLAVLLASSVVAVVALLLAQRRALAAAAST